MKTFTMRDEACRCGVSGADVKPLKYTARDHCPFCLSSMHVDINPGDRQCDCHGVLEPVGVEKYRDTYKIIYRCQKCGAIKKNIAASDDDFDKIIELSANPAVL